MLVKRGFATGQVMVVLVTGTPVFTAKKHFVAKLRELHPEITTILQNVNDKRTSLVLGEREKVLYGPGYIVDELCGCRFRISAKSFYQINPAQTEVLYSKAMEFAELTGKEKVLDAYCGIGTIGLVAAKHGAGQVLGVELNPEAVKDAIQNAKENAMKNAWFTRGDAGEFLAQAAQDGGGLGRGVHGPAPGRRQRGVPHGPGRLRPPGGWCTSPATRRPWPVTWASSRPTTTRLSKSSRWICSPTPSTSSAW